MSDAALQVSVGLDGSKALQDAQQIARKVEGILRTAQSQGLAKPLGQISDSALLFAESLKASNARVLAFGASAGIVLKVKDAMVSLVDSTIEVEKSLKDINVILNAGQSNLNKFANSLFQIAAE